MPRRRRDEEALDRALALAQGEAADARAGIDRLSAAIEALGEAVVVVDQDGKPVLRNAAASRFEGARHADAVAEEVLEELLGRALLGETVERELPLFGPPRQVLSVRAMPLRIDGALLGAVAIVRDVSEFKRVESVRRDFVANVSHELKTPIGALALLAETIADGDDPVAMHQLSERLVREADRLSRIIDDLLDLSLIEAQEGPSRDPIPVRVLLEEAIERVKAVALTRNIPLNESPISEDLSLKCDAGQIVSAITNLLDNALKYSDEGQSVEVSATKVDGRVVIEVSDHGIGIPPRDLERIFERFYRVDKARSRATGGTGLGLSIVRHVAQAHGGDVTVESREGEGSTFRFAVPLEGEGSTNSLEAS